MFDKVARLLISEIGNHLMKRHRMDFMTRARSLVVSVRYFTVYCKNVCCSYANSCQSLTVDLLYVLATVCSKINEHYTLTVPLKIQVDPGDFLRTTL